MRLKSGVRRECAKVSQYSYAKDNRTDAKYQSDFDGGTHNQETAIAQLVIDRYLQDGSVIEYKHNPDKTFQNEQGFWEYNPDYIVITDNKEIPIEVKVQMTDLGDDIDLKASQINKLIKLRGAILYATKTKYCLVYAEQIKLLGNLVNSERFGGKPVYQVDTNNLVWSDWIHYPEFIGY